LPEFSISGFKTLGENGYTPAVRVSNDFQWNDDVTMIRGRHTLKGGIQVLRLRYNAFQSSSARGDMTFSKAFTSNPASPAGTVFLRGYSAGAWTTPSFGAILTGLFPSVHGMTLPPYQSCGPSITQPLTSGSIPAVPSFLPLSPNKKILPELLKEQGFATAVDIANCWAIWDVMTRGWDTLQFFPGYQLPDKDHPGVSSFYLTAPQTTSFAQQWLGAHREQRFFLWVHYMEPHSPYNAPREYDHFKSPDDYPAWYDDNPVESDKLHRLAQSGNPHAIRRLEQLYAAKILYADHYIGELLGTVRSLGLDKNTIIILVSDHAQLLYSHPKDFNTDDHRSLYDANLAVPLIFWGPGIKAGRRVNALACHYDLLPTILDLEGLPIPAGLDGVSLKPVLDDKAPQVHRYLYGEETALVPQYSVRDERYKLIETLRDGKIQCFDNATDPREAQDICAQIPAKAAELKAALDEQLKTIVSQAKSFPDWENNLALAVIEQRDSKGLATLAPREHIVSASDEGDFQLTGSAWSLVQLPTEGADASFWAPPGPATALAQWRSDTPLIGVYDIYVRYDAGGNAPQTLATNANFTVHFKGGSLSFPIDENHNQAKWNLLGRFRDPFNVELTNQADGPVITGVVRFNRLSD
jgi:arylsulfatase A-like enzyme